MPLQRLVVQFQGAAQVAEALLGGPQAGEPQGMQEYVPAPDHQVRGPPEQAPGRAEVAAVEVHVRHA
ncbi:hypothetical protein K7787_28485 [Streptomyces sp. RCPT1-4]|nr:hypothetical protein [Streptomyces sennicomposti]MBY8869653.1 hypothetical protein [Streptomyces sennicomposti]